MDERDPRVLAIETACPYEQVRFHAVGLQNVGVNLVDDLCERARRAAGVAWWPLVILTALSLITSLYVRPQALDNFNSHPWGWLIPAMVVVSLVALPLCRLRKND